MDTKQIEATLSTLAYLYDKYEKRIGEQHSLKLQLISKLAILELCGWLEEMRKELITLGLNQIQVCIQGKPSQQTYQAFHSDVSKKVKDIHGVSYKNYFSVLFRMLLGDAYLVKLQAYLGEEEFILLSSILDNLHVKRNDLAHKSVINITQQTLLTSPRELLRDFQTIKPILNKIETFLSRL